MSAQAPASSTPPSPAHRLLGEILLSGWKLVQKLALPSRGTGSNFGACYIAERGQEKAFVKAIDFVKAINADDPFAELQRLTSYALFERDAMTLCGERRLSRLVQLISHEYINLDPSRNPLSQVFCLVMEIGEGDLRRQITKIGAIPASVNFGILSDVSLGLAQLHRHGVAHQDVKPSNVISMNDMSKPDQNLFKVADLGRIVHKEKAGPYDRYHWPGDRHYMPPERWYGLVPQQWNDAREASDAYMLGSLIFFLFTGSTLQSLLLQRIPAPMQPAQWQGGYQESLIHVLRSLQYNLIAETLLPLIPESCRDSLADIAKELVEPDPTKRGDKRARRQVGRPVGIERFQPRFHLLKIHSAVSERKGKR